MKKAIVITPTTGSKVLKDNINSVREQTYSNTHHLLVVDGSQFSSAVDGVLKEVGVIGYGEKFFRCDIPFNTGGGGYYGHRVMAAFGHLIPDYDYVLFLDQDNWYDPEHVETLVHACERNNKEWSYSFRKIFDKDKNFLCEDNCESLGKWPVWVDQDAYLIDTSSYCFKVDFFKTCSHLWDFGWGADRRFFTIVKNNKSDSYESNYKHTLNYRLGGNEGSVQKEFFEKGNQLYLNRYNGKYPWKRLSL